MRLDSAGVRLSFVWQGCPGGIPVLSVLRRAADPDDPRKARLWVETIGNQLARSSEFQARAAYGAIIADRLTLEADTSIQRARIRLAALVHVSGMAYAITDWLHGGIELTREQFVDELATLYVASIEAIGRRTPT